MPYTLCVLCESDDRPEEFKQGQVEVLTKIQDGMGPGNLSGLEPLYPGGLAGSCYLIYVRPAGYTYPTSNPFFEEGFLKDLKAGEVPLSIPSQYRPDVQAAIEKLVSRKFNGRLFIFGECNGSVTGWWDDPAQQIDPQWTPKVNIRRLPSLSAWWELHDRGNTFDTTIYEIESTGKGTGSL